VNNEDKKYLKKTIELAKESVGKGGFPAGALIVKDGKVISEGLSVGNLLNDPTSHAETASIREACKKLKTSNLERATLYESIECCVMCFSVAYWAGISRIVYACRKTPEMVLKFYYEGNSNNQNLNRENNRKMKLVFIPDFEKESLAAVKKWENNLR
jgi:guanine deaminase